MVVGPVLARSPRSAAPPAPEKPRYQAVFASMGGSVRGTNRTPSRGTRVRVHRRLVAAASISVLARSHAREGWRCCVSSKASVSNPRAKVPASNRKRVPSPIRGTRITTPVSSPHPHRVVLRFGVLVLPDAPFPTLFERWTHVEELGFDFLFAPDHARHTGDPSVPWFDGLTVVAAMALRTDAIRIGTRCESDPASSECPR
jgi:hypothetical protein